MRGRTVRSLMVGALAGLLAVATAAAFARRARRQAPRGGWSAIDPGFRVPSPDPSAIDPRFHLPPSHAARLDPGFLIPPPGRPSATAER